MKYVNDTVRRRDRLLDEQRACELLATSEYGVLSMTDEEGRPYGIPVNFVWNGEDVVYIHCAPEGKKPIFWVDSNAAKTIEQHRPKLAVCVYHSLEDYVRIPELLMERYPFYRFFLRQHSATSGETVLYAL